MIFTRNLWVAGFFWAVTNAIVQFEVSQIIGFRLRVTAEAYVGRVFGAVRLFVLSGIGPAVIVFGYVADHAGPRTAMAISALGYLAVAVIAAISPAIRSETR